MQDSVLTEAKINYDAALAMGIAKEQARALLPEGLTVSRLYMAGTLRSWIHYCVLRTKADTQAEHRQVAESAKQHILELFPSLMEWLNAKRTPKQYLDVAKELEGLNDSK